MFEDRRGPLPGSVADLKWADRIKMSIGCDTRDCAEQLKCDVLRLVTKLPEALTLVVGVCLLPLLLARLAGFFQFTYSMQGRRWDDGYFLWFVSAFLSRTLFRSLYLNVWHPGGLFMNMPALTNLDDMDRYGLPVLPAV